MNKQNAAKVTKEVKVLTSDPDDMNEADAVLIADVIDSVVLLDDSLNEVKHEQNINGQTRAEPTEIRRCGPKTAGNSKNQIKIEMKSIRKTNEIIPRLALCSRDIAKNSLCQKIILFIALTRKNNRKPFCRTFWEHLTLQRH